MKILFDYTNLIHRIYANGHNIKSIISHLRVDEESFLRKIAGLEEFTQEEMSILALDILEIDPAEIPQYFFKEME